MCARDGTSQQMSNSETIGKEARCGNQSIRLRLTVVFAHTLCHVCGDCRMARGFDFSIPPHQLRDGEPTNTNTPPYDIHTYTNRHWRKQRRKRDSRRQGTALRYFQFIAFFIIFILCFHSFLRFSLLWQTRQLKGNVGI